MLVATIKMQQQQQQNSIQTIEVPTQNRKEIEELTRSNQRLSDTVSRIEERNRALQQKVDAHKVNSRVLKHALSMQCKFCQVFHPAEIFIEHVKQCTSDSRATRSHFYQIPLSISIQSTQMVEEESDNRTYTEYVILITFNGQCWTANQKYKTFCALHESLINQYPSVTFPATSYQFAKINSTQGVGQSRSVDRCKTL